MPKPMDLRGQKYGKLTAVELMPHVPGTKPRWLCHCECGGEKIVTAFSLRKGAATRCNVCRVPHWTRQQVQTLRDLKSEGKTGREIAKILGRSETSISQKLKGLANIGGRNTIKPDGNFQQYMNAPCQRNCLRCGKKFSAASRKNRLCYSCNSFAQDAAPI